MRRIHGFLHQKVVSSRYLQIWANDPELSKRFDVIVVGGGHAGCEGAAAAARCGSRVLLITHNVNTIGIMSCNPSFGGIGKGHLMRELDAFDGVSPRICDQSAITFQALNRSHGPAVLGLRAQMDREIYLKNMQQEILNTPGLMVLESAVEDLVLEESTNKMRIYGCVLGDGTIVNSNTVMLTTGTFLSAEIYRGMTSKPAGRIGDAASYGLSRTFNRLGFVLGRLRTGTPPRLDADTIDFTKFEEAPPDQKPIPFSYLTKKVWIGVDQQLSTHFGYTNQKVVEIINKNLDQNLHATGGVTGPRYCPSLETKVIRFPKLNHRFFLEREGLNCNVVYMQGSTMTNDEKIQDQIVNSIKGLENTKILQYGYGVQYDYVNPKQLQPWLETRKVEGLFLAGQINGTTGYEEAASQGVLAGINCVWRSKTRSNCQYVPREPLTVCRSEGYMGVLVDDLINFGVKEPYRMFTSRVEFRLHLRPDNADLRLTEKAKDYGVLSPERWAHYSTVKADFTRLKEKLMDFEISLYQWSKVLGPMGYKLNGTARKHSAYEMMHRHDVKLQHLYEADPDAFKNIVDLLENEDIQERVRLDGMYSHQHARYMKQMNEMKQEMTATLPEDLDYSNVEGLNLECREKLDSLRPLNLAAASRIEGMTPEALITLLRYTKGRSKRL
ncbi:unnamed protein product [Bursaphelenchus okinawaensis]|uniref:tRNA uridine 5-carboxymethylaminomethyl modification enzyme C-terminal subdomain domain-containing protein n=1 Tax=Bursaphelenchus okinawaensis TaxID=465554 RepID=A0A811KBB4_9BILA|nr:unnamed protein product [Bursaphelenchus okinawaensis]CAG9097113.1 unnamed protein product [Bursaphelenchus okinawaensis]